nr:retrovirus-related Pol polyprotein from transposon TNT 1-94 [Tanacetum cinerariifolium]
MQTQTSNNLHNAIMEAGSKDRPPMLAPGIDNDIYSTVDACPNACEIWKVIERLKQGKSINVQDLETNLYWEFRKFTSQDGESLESYYSRFYKMMNELIRNQCNSQELKTVSYHKLYDILKQHQHEVNEIRAEKIARVANPLALVAQQQPDKEIDKLMALISLSFKKIYKPTNNNLRTRNVGYENQRIGNVVGARETVGSTVEEAGIQLNAEQADWRDDTDDDELEDQELEAHYMYMAQLQEVSPDDADSGPMMNHCKRLSETNNLLYADYKKSEAKLAKRNSREYASQMEIECIKVREQKVKVLDNIVYKTDQSLQTMNMLHNKCQTSFAKSEFLNKAQRANPRLYDIGCYNDNLALMLAPDSDKVIRLEKESRSKLSDLIRPFDYDKLNNLYDLFVPQREKSSEQRYFSERSRLIHTNVTNGKLNESFNKETTLLEKRMDESILLDKKCQSSIEIFNVKTYFNTIINGVELCKEKIANRTYIGYIDPFIQSTIESNFSPIISRINASLDQFHRKSTCFIRDLKRNDLLTGSCGTDLYSITLQDTNCPNPICLMVKATSSHAWLWHRHLFHLNFDTINLLLKNDIVVGLPKLKFVKDHLCSSCELGKAKRKFFHIKLTPSLKRPLQLLHMDLCGPMRVASINGKRYVLVIVDDYSRYTWTHFLRSKHESPEVLIDFLRRVQKGLQAQVRVVQTDKGTEFVNQNLHAYFAAEGILHQMSVARTPKQNGVVERQNRTLVEAARTMLSVMNVSSWDILLSRAYRVFNKRTRVIMESIHVNFDELPHMASDHISSDPAPECQRVELEHNSLSPAIQRQTNVPQADRTVNTSNELDLLFSLMFDELLNGSSKVVSKSSVVCSDDAPNQCQQHTTPLNIHTTPAPTCKFPSLAPTVTSYENINQAETYAENDQVTDDEFINIFC